MKMKNLISLPDFKCDKRYISTIIVTYAAEKKLARPSKNQRSSSDVKNS